MAKKIEKKSKRRINYLIFVILFLFLITLSFLITKPLRNIKPKASTTPISVLADEITPDKTPLVFPITFKIKKNNPGCVSYTFRMYKNVYRAPLVTGIIIIETKIPANSNSFTIHENQIKNSIHKFQEAKVTFITENCSNKQSIQKVYSYNLKDSYYTKNDRMLCAANVVDDTTPGNFNLPLNIFDMLYLKKHYNNKVGKYGPGDPTGDGIINIFDIQWVENHFSTVFPEGLICPPRAPLVGA